MDKYNTFSRRFVALIIDGIILSALNFLLEQLYTENRIVILTVSFLVLVFPYLYSILFHAKFGQTIGKMICKVKVIDVTETKEISLNQAFLRDAIPLILVVTLFIMSNIVLSEPYSESYQPTAAAFVILLIPSLLIYIWSILEIVTLLGDRKSRALHDKIANTVVVKE